MRLVERHRCHGGSQSVHVHDSQATGTPMRFALYLPPAAEHGPVPLVTFLAGLTCTEENFTVKAGAQRVAAELGLALLAPDTSPRGTDLPGEHESWDFGSGAGFYLDATQAPWSAHYRMATWLTEELPALLAGAFPLDMARQGISGHSMGGHGAMVTALRAPGRYRSVSAFAPICAPSRCPWGEKAFSRYLGDDRSAWRAWDTVALIEDGGRLPDLLVDQGSDDPFLAEQLRPDLLQAACAATGIPLTLRHRPGYDHSYYFITTFVDDHLRWHGARLTA